MEVALEDEEADDLGVNGFVFIGYLVTNVLCESLPDPGEGLEGLREYVLGLAEVGALGGELFLGEVGRQLAKDVLFVEARLRQT